MSQFESKLTAFSISIAESPDDVLLGLAELADHAFALVTQYSASTSATSSNIPLDAAFHRFAVVLYPIVQMGNPEFTPVKAILHENRPEQPQRVVVDFQTMTVEYEGPGTNLPIRLEEIERALDGIKVHIRDNWRSNGVEKPTDWNDFLQRLESSGVLPAKPYPDRNPTSIYKRCPLCEMWTLRCTSCYAIMCSNGACVASQVIPSRSCSHHPSKAMCLPCLQTEKIEWRLGQCPQCERWFCFSELRWCIGQPPDYSHGSRGHALKPIGCLPCVGARDYCANTNCWSNRGAPSTGVCGPCSPEGGLRCVCLRSWICDTCRMSRTDKLLVECPRCSKVYCLAECNYIGHCSECGRTTVCNDCFEEEGGVAMDVDVVVLKSECGNPECTKKICAECVKVARCADCDDPTCGYCSLQASGDLGDGRVCAHCFYKRFEVAVERQCMFE